MRYSEETYYYTNTKKDVSYFMWIV